MALRDTWHRSLVYFGLAEDTEYHEADLYEPDTAPHGQVYETAAPRTATVSRISERRRSRDEIDDIFADDDMQKIAEKTFLLTPRNVEVSAEEKARLVEKGFFNQS